MWRLVDLSAVQSRVQIRAKTGGVRLKSRRNESQDEDVRNEGQEFLAYLGTHCKCLAIVVVVAGISIGIGAICGFQ